MFDPFAELNRLNIGVKNAARNGISVNDLAQTAEAVFRRCQGVKPEWSALREVDRQLWIDAASAEVGIIDIPETEQAALEVSAKSLAKTIYMQYTSKFEAELWNALEEREQIAWEAVARHLANIIDADSAVVDFANFEDMAVSWGTNRSQQLVSV